jgi:hypothetical protein
MIVTAEAQVMNAKSGHFMLLFHLRNLLNIRAPVVHTCNPSYIGGRDQEDGGLRLAQTNNS